MTNVYVEPRPAAKRFDTARLAAWAALPLLIAAALALVLVPAWVVHPFKPQTREGLELSYALRGWSPLMTVALAAAAVALVVWMWRGTRRWWRKTLLVLALAPLVACAWLARQNHFEWMFSPLARAAYAQAAEASFVEDADMVIAVEVGGERVAYPVRLLAYHHLVHDVVGGTPLVSTY